MWSFSTKAFVDAPIRDGQDICNPLQPNGSQTQADLIYTDFMKAFLSRNDSDGWFLIFSLNSTKTYENAYSMKSCAQILGLSPFKDHVLSLSPIMDEGKHLKGSHWSNITNHHGNVLVALPDPRCLKDTPSSSQWVNINFGPFVQSASLKGLGALNRNFTAVSANGIYAEFLKVKSIVTVVLFLVLGGCSTSSGSKTTIWVFCNSWCTNWSSKRHQCHAACQGLPASCFLWPLFPKCEGTNQTFMLK